MSRVCSVCGKGQTSGNNVSHSKRRTRRTFKANVQKISYIDAKGNAVTGYVCTRCMKWLSVNGEIMFFPLKRGRKLARCARRLNVRTTKERWICRDCLKALSSANGQNHS